MLCAKLFASVRKLNILATHVIWVGPPIANYIYSHSDVGNCHVNGVVHLSISCDNQIS